MSRRRYTVSIGGRSYIVDVRETAADRFEAEVEGRRYEATLEGDHDLPGGGISPEMPVPADTPAALPGAMPRSPAPAAGAPTGGGVVAAPLPGIVLEVAVKPGVVVRRGDPLVVLEAMKMRNTIRSPKDAAVLAVMVQAGQPVAANDDLVRLGDST